MEKLKASLTRDIFLGSTSKGIHKDDVYAAIDGKDAKIFASQGQARCAAVSVKLAQMKMYTAEKGEKPVMLLDDVFSELDAKRQRRLVEELGGVQAVITCTGAESAANALYKGSSSARRFIVENGNIKQ